MPPNTSSNLNIPPAAPAPSPTVSTNLVPAQGIQNPTKASTSKRCIWIIAALSLVAVAAIIFGIAQMIQNFQNKEESANLAAELEEKTQLVTKYAAQLGLDVSQSNNPNMSPSKPNDTNNQEDEKQPTTSDKNISTVDYIYIGEWGIKIKIPTKLKNVSYRFDNIRYAATDTSKAFTSESLCVSGILNTMNVTPEAFRVDQHVGLGCLSRTTDPTRADSPNIVKKEGDYYYEYAHPQAVVSTNIEEQKQELEVVNLIQQMLTNPDNLTAI